MPAGFEGSFAEYSLFDNELDDTLAFVAYTGYTTGQHHKIGLSSEWTTNGQYPKAWRRVDGELYLYKARTEGYANSGMEPYSEYFAAQAAKAFGVSHVPYELEKWQGKLASVCKLMNDKQTSFVPFWPATTQSNFPENLAAAYLISDDAGRSMCDMLVFDALICNTDRHANTYVQKRVRQMLEIRPSHRETAQLVMSSLPAGTDIPALKVGTRRPR